MACSLLGAKPLPKQMLANCKWGSMEQNSVEFESKFYHLIQENTFENIISHDGGPFLQTGGVKNAYTEKCTEMR